MTPALETALADIERYGIENRRAARQMLRDNAEVRANLWLVSSATRDLYCTPSELNLGWGVDMSMPNVRQTDKTMMKWARNGLRRTVHQFRKWGGAHNYHALEMARYRFRAEVFYQRALNTPKTLQPLFDEILSATE